MAYNLPTIPDDKRDFFRRRLIREVSNFFKWEGLEELNIPVDLMEYNLITLGRLMFFSDDTFGYVMLPANFKGYNMYNEPTLSRAITPQGSDSFGFGEKNIIYFYTPGEVDISTSCVLLDNMLYGESLFRIIEFYSQRMAMAWQTFDTNLLWQNLPAVISVQNESTRLSIEKALDDIWTGRPVLIKDEQLKLSEGDNVQFGLAEAPIILKELMDAYQEIYNDFKATIGISATAVDKQSGVSDVEASSNDQHVRTALEVMYSQRKKFCRLVKKVYGLDINVTMQGESEVSEDGESDDRASELSEDPDF